MSWLERIWAKIVSEIRCELSVAPVGCYRIIGVDVVNDVRYIVGDYRHLEEAMKRYRTLMAKRRRKRNCRDDMYFVYDDHGRPVSP